MQVIAVLNQKGGVGKTTTSLNVGHALALAGCRVLMIDLDPQGHLTASWGLHGTDWQGIDAVLSGVATLEDCVRTVRERVDVVPSGSGLVRFEQDAAGGIARGYRLREVLQGLDYNYVLLDCPPSSGLIAMNALLAADQLLIPVSSDYLSLNGLARMMSVLRAIEGKTHSVTDKRILLTRYQARRRLAREVREKLEQHFGEELLRVAVREAVAIAESPSYGQSIFEYRPNGHGAEDYRALGAALMEQAARPAA